MSEVLEVLDKPFYLLGNLVSDDKKQEPPVPEPMGHRAPELVRVEVIGVSGLAPDRPFASAFARRSIAARATSAGYGSPTPQAWLRSSRSWSSSVNSSGMV